MSEDVKLFKQALGRRISSLRKEKGLTQSELSSLINKDFQSISRIENGKINPSAFLIYQIAQALEISVGDIFKEMS